MKQVIGKIVETEKEADRILSEAREQVAAKLAAADEEVSRDVRAAREEGRKRVAEEMHRIDEEESARVEKSLSSIPGADTEDTELIEALARSVAKRITTTIFDTGL